MIPTRVRLPLKIRRQGTRGRRKRVLQRYRPRAESCRLCYVTRDYTSNVTLVIRVTRAFGGNYTWLWSKSSGNSATNAPSILAREWFPPRE